MMNHTLTAGAALLFGAVAALSAQRSSADLVVGSRVIILVPLAAFTPVLDTGPKMPVARIALAAGRIIVNGSAEWRAVGFNRGVVVVVAGITEDPATAMVDVTLDDGQRGLGLSYAHRDARQLAPLLFASPNDSAQVRSDNRAALRARIFTGPMATLSPGSQESILDVLRGRSGNSAIQLAEFQGERYLLLRTSESAYTCLAGDVPDPERQMAALREVAAPIVFNWGRADSTMSGASGFAIEVQMKESSSCARAQSPELLTIYVPAKVAADYGRGAISDSAVVMRSVVVLRGKVQGKV